MARRKRDRSREWSPLERAVWALSTRERLSGGRLVDHDERVREIAERFSVSPTEVGTLLEVVRAGMGNPAQGA